MGHLQNQLDEITALTRALVQPERLAPPERLFEELFRSGAEEKILPVGATAPDFVLDDITGKPVRLSDMLALGPVVVSFFRGRWCPYCVTELETWRNLYDGLRKRGALIAAISPQSVQQNDFLCAQHQIPFPVLRDEANQIAAQYGLAYAVPEEVREHYLSCLVNLGFINGEPSWTLPIPATFLVGSDGKILFAEAHADFRVRPEPEEILAVLDRL